MQQTLDLICDSTHMENVAKDNLIYPEGPGGVSCRILTLLPESIPW